MAGKKQMSAWSHLPNAAPIDWVLADLKAHPERWGAARDAIAALIAYDDCAYVFELASGAVRLMASTGHPAAILLYPAVLAKSS